MTRTDKLITGLRMTRPKEEKACAKYKYMNADLHPLIGAHKHVLKTNNETIHWLNCIQLRQMRHSNRVFWYYYEFPCVNQFLLLRFICTNQRLEQQQLGVKHSFSSLFMYSGVNCFVCLFFLFIYWGYFECPKECEWESVTAWKKKDKMHTYENTRKRMCAQCAFANYIDGESKKRRRRLIFPWIFFKRLHTIRFLNLLFAL